MMKNRYVLTTVLFGLLLFHTQVSANANARVSVLSVFSDQIGKCNESIYTSQYMPLSHWILESKNYVIKTKGALDHERLLINELDPELYLFACDEESALTIARFIKNRFFIENIHISLADLELRNVAIIRRLDNRIRQLLFDSLPKQQQNVYKRFFLGTIKAHYLDDFSFAQQADILAFAAKGFLRKDARKYALYHIQSRVGTIEHSSGSYFDFVAEYLNSLAYTTETPINAFCHSPVSEHLHNIFSIDDTESYSPTVFSLYYSELVNYILKCPLEKVNITTSIFNQRLSAGDVDLLLDWFIHDLLNRQSVFTNDRLLWLASNLAYEARTDKTLKLQCMFKRALFLKTKAQLKEEKFKKQLSNGFNRSELKTFISDVLPDSKPDSDFIMPTYSHIGRVLGWVNVDGWEKVFIDDKECM